MKPILLFALLLTLFAGGVVAAERGPATQACPQGVATLRLLRSINNPPQPDVVDAWKAANPCVKIDVSEVHGNRVKAQVACWMTAAG